MQIPSDPLGAAKARKEQSESNIRRAWQRECLPRSKVPQKSPKALKAMLWGIECSSHRSQVRVIRGVFVYSIAPTPYL